MDKQKYQSIFISAYETSAILGIPLDSLYYLSRKGKIRAIKIGKHWKYKKSDIEKYLNYGTDFSKEPVPSKTWDCPTQSIYIKDGAAKAREKPVRRPDPLTCKPAERRAYQRINSNLQCRYSINLQPFKEINDSGIIKNISAGGVFLFRQAASLNEIEIDDPVSLDFILNFDPEPSYGINIKGKVVRNTEAGLGIKFKNINKEMHSRIIEYAG